MNLNKKLVLLAVGISSSIFSCSPEETKKEDLEKVVVKLPEVTLTVDGNTEKLHNEVPISLTSQASDGIIEKVEFFVNDKSIGVDEEEPFEINWNTKEMEDGKYLLKIIASNAHESSTTTQDVTVKNTLFTVNVPVGINQGREFEKRDLWIFLSDKSGKTLGLPQQAVDGSQAKFYRPAGYDSDSITFNVVHYYVYEREGMETRKSVNVYSYTDLTLEGLSLRAGNVSESKEVIGRASFVVENDFDGTRTYDYSTQGNPGYKGMRSSSENAVSYGLDMTSESVEGFSTYETSWYLEGAADRNKFFRIDEIGVGQRHTFNTADYKPMKRNTVMLPGNLTDLMIVSRGINAYDQEFDMDFVWLMDPNQTEVDIFSTDYFPGKRVWFNASAEGKTFFYETSNAPTALNIPEFSASIVPDGKNGFKVENVLGGFDIGNAGWSHSIKGEGESFYISKHVHFSPESGVSYAIPEVPTEVVALYPQLEEELTFKTISLSEYNDLSGYSDIVNYVYREESVPATTGNYASVTLYPESNSGGRISRKNSAEETRKRMEEESLRARGIFRKLN